MRTLAVLAAGLLAAFPVLASDAVQGTVAEFTSPNGVVERCVRIASAPGGDYDKDDLEDEAAYAPSTSMPPTWLSAPRHGAPARAR